MATSQPVHLLDTLPEKAFDDLTGLAALVCDTPVAVVTLIEEKRQWVKARPGLMTQGIPRELVFCTHCLRERDLMVVPDALRDARFAAHSLVRGEPHIRFYAGIPLRDRQGHPLGTVAVLDFVPRELSPQQLESLRGLGRQALNLLELRRSRADLEEAQAVGHVGSWVSDLGSLGTLTWSKEALRIFGLTEADFDGRVETFWKFVHPDDLRTVQAVRQAALDGTQVYDLEHRIVRRDGVARTVRQRAHIERDAAGKPLRIVGAIQDITEQVRAQETLRESEERFRVLAEASFEGIAITEQGVLLDCSEQLAQMLGYRRSDLVGQSVSRFIVPEDRELVAEAQKGGCLDLYEHWMVRSDGTRFPVAVRARSAQFGGRRVRITAINDITDRKRAEETLRETNEKLQALIRACPEAIMVLDPDGHLRLWNPAAENTFGWREAEVLGGLPPFIPTDELEEHRAILERALRGEAFTGVEVRRRNKGGTPLDLSVSVAPLRDAQGRVTGIMLVCIDITERRRADAERRHLELQMQQAQKMESIGLLAGGIAHDFNNLLMVILAHAELALAGLPAESPLRLNLDGILHASQRAAELCRQLLAYAGRGRLSVEPINLSHLVAELLPLLKVSIPKKVSLRCDCTENLPCTEADPTQLRQVIMNLVINGAEAIGDQEGVVSIATGVRHYDGASLDNQNGLENLVAGTYVHLQVTDTGCGMDSKTQARAFDPFFTTKFTGRGLGLPAVLGIVRSHGGGINLQSTPGHGTTFTVLLPASTKATHGSDPCPQPEEWRGSGTVLVVDDEEPVRDVAARMLEWIGFRVITAADGREAVERFRASGHEITCILLDLTMPRMGGEETARELRRLRPDVPIILASGYSANEITRRFATDPPAGFISKPYQMQEFITTLRQVLAPARGERK